MSKNGRYRNKPCGYCGTDTGKDGEGEHVIPKSLYPLSTSPKVQRLKIPACPACNDSWQADEAHFRTFITACGLNLTPQRAELWANASRSFRREDGGEADREAIRRCLVPTGLLSASGLPICKLYPARDERVSRVVRKIIRGLIHHRDRRQVVDEDSRVLVTHELPSADEIDRFAMIYHVPNVFAGRAKFFAEADYTGGLHSMWVLDFLDNVRLCGIVSATKLGK